MRQAERLRSLLPSGLRCAARIGVALVLLFASWAQLTPTALAAQTATNDGASAVCDAKTRLMSVIASEATRQPYEAQLEVARAMMTKGVCTDDESYLAGLRVARQALNRGDSANHHARAYNDLYSFPLELRQQWERAAHTALTEQPPVRRYHFDRSDAPLYDWWLSPRSCPNGYWTVGELRVC